MARAIPTLKERDAFLKLVADGKNRAIAAKIVGSTGTAFRSLCRRDTKFNDLYEQARHEGDAGRVDELRQTFWERAMAGSSQGSDRLLLQLGMVYLPEFEVLRKQRIEMTGADGGPLEVQHVEGAAERLRARLAAVIDLDAERATRRATG